MSSAGESGRSDDSPRTGNAGGEATTVLPETAAQLVEMEQLQQALAQSEERARNHWEQYLRAVAENENVRRRAQRDVENASRYGLERFANELLPVRDSLELAVENDGAGDPQSIVAGHEATLKLLARAFEKLGIGQIDPLGQVFDPAKHEAILARESTSAAPGTVLQVVQPGYELNGRLLRPARVVVSKEPQG